MSHNKVLVIDRDPVLRSGVCNYLVQRGHLVAEAATLTDAQSQLERFRPDAAILDFSFPNGDAVDLLRRMKSIYAHLPVIALVGQNSSELAIRAIEHGADQLLGKPIELQLLDALLRRTAAGEWYRAVSPAPPKPKRENIDPFVGSSPLIRRLKELATRGLESNSPVMLQGETGSGKGVLAAWMHRNGPRAGAPFLDLNCAGLSRELLESELFGHERGAFTSAQNTKPGLLEGADKGTVLLDEIGDMDLQVQPKLLKVLEGGAFRRLGGLRDRVVDVRLISATHRNLLQLVREQHFRSDLYFRLNIVSLRVPPLRERVEDIPALAACILRSFAHQGTRGEVALEPAAVDALQRYAWPGNIRELRNVLERAVLVARDDRIAACHLEFQSSSWADETVFSGPTGTLKQMERAYIHQVLHSEGGSMERTARRLGIARSSLYEKMKRHAIQRPSLS